MERAVLVGCGTMARRWIEALEGSELAGRIEIVGLVDVAEGAAEKFRDEARLPEASVGRDLSTILDRCRPDVVLDVVVPDSRHDVVVTAMRHGCHVLSEKPMAASMEQARALVVLARKAGRVHAIVQNRRYIPGVRRIRKLIESGAVDVIVSVGPNFFLTVTLPCTLWFFDRAKPRTSRADEVLFIDARHIFHQVDRAHRDFREEQIEFLANIVRLWRGNAPELAFGSTALLRDRLGGLEAYRDVPGLCHVATRDVIEAQGWSLNPGRYVGVAEGEADAGDFKERLEALQEELERLNGEALELQGRIALNVAELLA